MKENLFKLFHGLRGILLFPLLGAALLLSCAKKQETYEGVTGNYYSVRVQPPLGMDNPSYGWDIIEVPAKSLLTFTDLTITENGQEMSFMPDAAGEYTFELVVLNDAGETAIAQTYKFLIAESPVTVVAEEVEEKEEGNEETRVVESETTGLGDTATAEEVRPQEMSKEMPAMAVADTGESVPKEISEINVEISRASEEEEPVESVEERESSVEPKVPLLADKIPTVEGRLTIQVSSWLAYEEAQSQMFELQDLGFDAYIQKAYFEETEEVWYRVRVGAFDNLADARTAIRKLQSLTDYSAWIDHVRVDL